MADTGELQELLRRHGPALRRPIERRIAARWRSVLDADDILQVTFLEAFRRYPEFKARGSRSFPAWLRRIAINNLIDAIRGLQTAKRTRPGTPSRDGAGDPEFIAGTGTAPSRAARREESRERVYAALDRLPPDYATAVRECDLKERPVDEVAAEMNRSPGAVYMLRARGREQLAALLGSASDFLSDRV